MLVSSSNGVGSSAGARVSRLTTMMRAIRNPSKARHEPRPMTLRNKIESSQNQTGSQQQAAEEPERRRLGRNTLLDRPPEAAEEERTEQGAGKERQGKGQDVTHPRSSCISLYSESTQCQALRQPMIKPMKSSISVHEYGLG